MANPMKIKRGLLKDFLEEVLQVHDSDYTIVDRLRMATFQQTSRAERIQVMGEKYAYGEVLYRPISTPEGQRSAGSTSRNRHHDYDVFIWYKYEDDDLYRNSSQKVWDDIMEADDGVIPKIEGKKYLEDTDGNRYTLSKPENIRAHEVVMDNNPLELAHFLNFRVTVRS